MAEYVSQDLVGRDASGVADSNINAADQNLYFYFRDRYTGTSSPQPAPKSLPNMAKGRKITFFLDAIETGTAPDITAGDIRASIEGSLDEVWNLAWSIPTEILINRNGTITQLTNQLSPAIIIDATNEPTTAIRHLYQISAVLTNQVLPPFLRLKLTSSSGFVFGGTAPQVEFLCRAIAVSES